MEAFRTRTELFIQVPPCQGYLAHESSVFNTSNYNSRFFDTIVDNKSGPILGVLAKHAANLSRKEFPQPRFGFLSPALHTSKQLNFEINSWFDNLSQDMKEGNG
jgi:hypothetical protein